jgi:hypothetical protein
MPARRLSSFATGPANSIASPISASLMPSIRPSAPADAPSVTVTKLGRTEVAISWPASLKKLVRPTLPTPRVSHLRSGSLGSRCVLAFAITASARRSHQRRAARLKASFIAERHSIVRPVGVRLVAKAMRLAVTAAPGRR